MRALSLGVAVSWLKWLVMVLLVEAASLLALKKTLFQLFFTAKACLQMGVGVGVSTVVVSFGHMIAMRVGARVLVDHNKLLLTRVCGSLWPQDLLGQHTTSKQCPLVRSHCQTLFSFSSCSQTWLQCGNRSVRDELMLHGVAQELTVNGMSNHKTSHRQTKNVYLLMTKGKQTAWNVLVTNAIHSCVKPVGVPQSPWSFGHKVVSGID